MDISLSKPDEGKERRKAYRVPITNMKVRVQGLKEKFPARDISVTGISFDGLDRPFKMGKGVVVDVLDGPRTVVSGLTMKIMHYTKGFVGGQFVKLTREQEDTLHSMVLAIQKKMAEKRKKK
jgi:hypothetical protein